MGKTISITIGEGSIGHNNREFFAPNVDKSRTPYNITLVKEDIKEVYHEIFDEALKTYNDKQKRKDRVIKDYYEHIYHSKQEKPFYELVVQIGNKDDTSCLSREGEISAMALKQFAEDFVKRNPHIRVFNSVIHLDEATPHLHIDFIPFATEQKRGLSTRNSLTKALEQQGFIAKGQLDTSSKLWVDSEKERLSEVMYLYGFEWEKLNTHNEHLSVLDFKKQKRTEEIQIIEDKIEKSSAELAELEEKISETEQIKTDIEAVNNIEVKSKLFTDKVIILKSDYDNLSAAAKKYASRISNEKKLQGEIEQLNKDKAALADTIRRKDIKINATNALKEKYEKESSELKMQVSTIKKKFEQMSAFIEQFNLKEHFERFVEDLNRAKNSVIHRKHSR